MRCASCGVENPDGMKFCEEYSTTLWTAGPSDEALVKPVGEWKSKSRTVTFILSGCLQKAGL
jgi:hypothetical protein